MRALPLALNWFAACLIVFSAWAERFERSQSKNTMNDGAAGAGGGGGATAAAGAPNLSCRESMTLMLLFIQEALPPAAIVGLVVPWQRPSRVTRNCADPLQP